jgi:endonuclease YncB( thermonuclease family)
MFSKFILAAAFAFASTAAAADPIGIVSVIDGDTLRMENGDVVCLNGIDAPEMAQKCDGPKVLRNCGVVAADALAERVAGKAIRCDGHEVDQYDRLIATCFVDESDIGEWMVTQGYAMAFVRYSDRYSAQEAAARSEGRGLWQTSLQPPWEYRAARWNVAEGDAPDGCPIKGNINRKGERIYHTPWGSRDYGRTKVDTSKGDRWFCSEREAVDAGWRAPLR